MNGMLDRQAPQQEQPRAAEQRRPNPGATPPAQRREPQGQQGGTYPANDDEVQQFIVDISNALTSGDHVSQMLNMVSKNEDKVGQVMGQIAGTILQTVVERRMQQNGRQPHANLVKNGLRMLLENMAEIIATSGIMKVTPQNLQEAAQMAGRVIDGGRQPEQQAPPQQPAQGVPQEGGMLG